MTSRQQKPKPKALGPTAKQYADLCKSYNYEECDRRKPVCNWSGGVNQRCVRGYGGPAVKTMHATKIALKTWQNKTNAGKTLSDILTRVDKSTKEGVQSNIYRLEDDISFYAFTDEEGQCPYYQDPENTNATVEKFQRDINSAALGIVGGLNATLADKVGFAFLGDVVDNGPYSIALLKNMVALKRAYPDRVILIDGNRDLNKIRMSDEYTIVYKEGESPGNRRDVLNGYQGDFVTLVKDVAGLFGTRYEFLMSSAAVLDRVDTYVHCHSKARPKGDAAVIDSDPYQRVLFLYGSTLGAAPEVTEWARLVELGLNDLLASDKEKAIALCILNMVMANRYGGDVSGIELPNGVNLGHINGLYLEYIRLSNIIAKVTYRGKHYLLSHHGYPAGDHTKTGMRLYDASYLDLDSEDIEVEIGTIYENYAKYTRGNTALFQIKSGVAEEYLNPDRMAVINQYCSLSGACPRDKQYSPIVSGSGRESDPKFIAEPLNVYMKSTGQRGGGRYTQARSQAAPGYDHIEAVVYGHIPQGFMPSVHYQDAGTKWICLDVSKANSRTSDSYSFAVYSFGDNLCLGRFEISPASGLGTVTGPADVNGRYNYAGLTNNVVVSKFGDYTPLTKTKGLVNRGERQYMLYNANDTGPPFKKHVFLDTVHSGGERLLTPDDVAEI